MSKSVQQSQTESDRVRQSQTYSDSQTASDLDIPSVRVRQGQTGSDRVRQSQRELDSASNSEYSAAEAQTIDGVIDLTHEEDIDCFLVTCFRYSPPRRCHVSPSLGPETSIRGCLAATDGCTERVRQGQTGSDRVRQSQTESDRV